jgi:hypothetical protein
MHAIRTTMKETAVLIIMVIGQATAAMTISAITAAEELVRGTDITKMTGPGMTIIITMITAPEAAVITETSMTIMPTQGTTAFTARNMLRTGRATDTASNNSKISTATTIVGSTMDIIVVAARITGKTYGISTSTGIPTTIRVIGTKIITSRISGTLITTKTVAAMSNTMALMRAGFTVRTGIMNMVKTLAGTKGHKTARTVGITDPHIGMTEEEDPAILPTDAKG